jgi:hypothetical protein
MPAHLVAAAWVRQRTDEVFGMVYGEILTFVPI